MGLNCGQSTYMWIFFNSKYFMVLHGPWLIESWGVEESQIRKADYKLYVDSRVHCINSCWMASLYSRERLTKSCYFQCGFLWENWSEARRDRGCYLLQGRSRAEHRKYFWRKWRPWAPFAYLEAPWVELMVLEKEWALKKGKAMNTWQSVQFNNKGYET